MSRREPRQSKRARKAARRPKSETPSTPQPVSADPRTWWLLAGLGVALLGVTLWAWPPRPAPEPHVERGNGLYARRDFRGALGEYEGAPGAGPRNAGVQLDRGLARYRVTLPPPDAGVLPLLPPDASAPEGLARAQDELRTAARGGSTNASEDVDAYLRARAAYDLANTLFSTRAWDTAIDAYKEALRLHPGFRDAAWNLELARRLREMDRNPPDAGQDSGTDASQDGAPPDASRDGGAQDSGDRGRDGGDQNGDGGTPRPDAGGQSGDAGGQGRDGGGGNDAAAPNAGEDAGPPSPADASAPRSMSPLDDLDRGSRSLQQELLRRRGVSQPRGPDDDR